MHNLFCLCIIEQVEVHSNFSIDKKGLFSEHSGTQ